MHVVYSIMHYHQQKRKKKRRLDEEIHTVDDLPTHIHTIEDQFKSYRKAKIFFCNRKIWIGKYVGHTVYMCITRSPALQYQIWTVHLLRVGIIMRCDKICKI